jgi:hypothetical protein
MLRGDFVSRYEREYPSATSCFREDFDACIADALRYSKNGSTFRQRYSSRR